MPILLPYILSFSDIRGEYQIGTNYFKWYNMFKINPSLYTCSNINHLRRSMMYYNPKNKGALIVLIKFYDQYFMMIRHYELTFSLLDTRIQHKRRNQIYPLLPTINQRISFVNRKCSFFYILLINTLTFILTWLVQ